MIDARLTRFCQSDYNYREMLHRDVPADGCCMHMQPMKDDLEFTQFVLRHGGRHSLCPYDHTFVENGEEAVASTMRRSLK